MSGNQGVLVLNGDTILRGEVRNCRQADVMGYFEGKLASETLIVHPGGRCFGTIKAGKAEVLGALQGTVLVKELISIRSSGSVSGSVRYGQMAMEPGGILSAQVSNVPPTIGGDMQLSVARGSAVPIHLEDLQAFDPDDDASHLTFSISNARNGHVAASEQPGRPLTHFTQGDLADGRILFQHNGTASEMASFDVVVADHTGASSGAPQTVHVAVRG